jgi:hypothetical protein
LTIKLSRFLIFAALSIFGFYFKIWSKYFTIMCLIFL